MNVSYLGIDHLGVVVHDLDTAIATYHDVLGFPLQGGETLPDRGLQVAFLDTGNARLELIAPTRPDSEISAFLAKRGEGLHHICLRVADIHLTLKLLKERGARVIGNGDGDGVSDGAHGTKVAFLHPKGSHGVLIELVEGKKP